MVPSNWNFKYPEYDPSQVKRFVALPRDRIILFFTLGYYLYQLDTSREPFSGEGERVSKTAVLQDLSMVRGHARIS
jgi:hypothetical protein